MNELITRALTLTAGRPPLSTSSNEVHALQLDGHACVLKTPLHSGDTPSPFWLMLQRIFGYTFARQARQMPLVCAALTNPHVPTPQLLAADARGMLLTRLPGTPRDEEHFPAGNANRLGRFIGSVHAAPHAQCGLLGVEDVHDFFAAALAHMEQVIRDHWHGDDPLQRRVRQAFDRLCRQPLRSARNALIMADQCADQYLFRGDAIAACVDLDACVVAPVEWELCLLQRQVDDWPAFRAGYEASLPLPDPEPLRGFFAFLLALNPWWDPAEMTAALAQLPL